MRNRILFLFLSLLLVSSSVLPAAAGQPPATLETGEHPAFLTGSGSPLPVFLPSSPLTRAHAAQMLHALLSEPSAVISCSDVPDSAWYTQPTHALGSLAAAPAEISDFHPEEPLSRAEFARCLSFFSPLRTDAEPFPDVPETHPDAPAILSARAYGWIQGDDNGCFRPEDSVTRAEAVVMLNRALGRTPDQNYIDRTKPAFYRDVTPANWYYYEIIEASVPHTHRTVEGAEQWTACTAPDPPPEGGFYLIDGQLYCYDQEMQDILRNESSELLSFNASGQCTARTPYLNKIARELAAAHEAPRLTRTEMEQLLSASEEPWNLLLVNGTHPLPEHFSVPELAELDNGYKIDSRVLPALQHMLDDARAAGYQPLVCSAYRTWDKQSSLHQKKIRYYLQQGRSREAAAEAAAFWVARPGTSEHQAGLAADIVDNAYPLLNKSQENRPVQKWLMEHCAEYGFILRYPTEKSALTGVGYEPWHYRYVGTEAAHEIMSRGLCLEEYLCETGMS